MNRKCRNCELIKALQRKNAALTQSNEALKQSMETQRKTIEQLIVPIPLRRTKGVNIILTPN